VRFREHRDRDRDGCADAARAVNDICTTRRDDDDNAAIDHSLCGLDDEYNVAPCDNNCCPDNNDYFPSTTDHDGGN
jgi:hypothetical protein